MSTSPTHVRFTKMQGAGNDFVVLDATRSPLTLNAQQLRRLGDRRFGVGADQILVIAPASSAEFDFSYRIFNNTGDEVEHCGNGARCFARYVRDHHLIDRDIIRVQTVNNELELQLQTDGRVRVDMNAPLFEHAQLPFDATGLTARGEGAFELWPLVLEDGAARCEVEVAVLSMGNPHAVHCVGDLDLWRTDCVAQLGPGIEGHQRFARQVNAGFMRLLTRSHIALRVYERGVGETLACGTGACAAVVAGIRLGWLDSRVEVETRGGQLTIEWGGGARDSVFLTGPATTVFEGEIEL